MKVNGAVYPTSLGLEAGAPASLMLEKYPNAAIAKDGQQPPDNYAYASIQNQLALRFFLLFHLFIFRSYCRHDGDILLSYTIATPQMRPLQI